MKKLKIKKKYIFLWDIDSINIELITKSFNFLKHTVEYILICNKIDFLKNDYFKKSNLILDHSIKLDNENSISHLFGNFFSVNNNL